MNSGSLDSRNRSSEELYPVSAANTLAFAPRVSSAVFLCTMSSPNAIVYAYASPGEVLAASIVLPVLGIIAVVARFIARSKKGSFIGTDDVTICLALVSVVKMLTPDQVSNAH